MIISLLSFLVGPIFQSFIKKNEKWVLFLDGYILTTLVGLLFAFLLPELFIQTGWKVFPLAFLGLFLPQFLKTHENHQNKNQFYLNKLSLFFIVLGLSLHDLLEGMALASSHLEGNGFQYFFGFAVVLHRLPIGLFVWLLVRSNLGATFAILSIFSLMLATTLGFFLTNYLSQWSNNSLWSYFQAFIVGTLAHIVYEHPFTGVKFHNGNIQQIASNWFSGLGGLLGIVSIFVLLNMDGFVHIEIAETYKIILSSVLQTALVSAPFLLIGYIFIGLLEVFLPSSSISLRYVLQRTAPWFLVGIFTFSLIKLFLSEKSNIQVFKNFINYISLFALSFVYLYFFTSNGPRKFFREMFPK